MFITNLGLKLAASIVLAFLLSFAMTPIVKNFALKVGAIDVPTDERRMHRQPIPRLGGLAILIGFLLAAVLFADLTKQVQGILVGAIIVAALGAVDDLISLKPMAKLIGQSVAAIVAISHGVTIHLFTNPIHFIGGEFILLEGLALPITFLWIVGVTNAVNLIDGLDGLACGVSAIASLTMFVVALLVAESNVAVLLAALMGACLGFLPYNMNPAKVFMGDTGALLLGYLLATLSVVGMFKFYAIVTFIVPVLALALPLLDTIFAIVRRMLRGQSPFTPDRGHLHHRLVDLGLNHKQAVALMYAISALLGLCAVVVVSRGPLRIFLLAVALLIAVVISRYIGSTVSHHDDHKSQ